MTGCLDAALRWAEIVPVVPLSSALANGGPRPLIRWKEDGPLRTDREIREFWARRPEAQLAIMLGSTTDGRYLGAVDTDLKNRRDGMPEPPTGFPGGYRHSTKSGGTHDLFYYRLEPPESVPRRAIGVGGFVDVLLDGLLVVPPSSFDGAGSYQVTRAGPVPEFEAPGLALQAASPWLRNGWKEYRPPKIPAGRPDDKEPIHEGARHATLLSRAGKLRDLGVGAEAILTDLRDFNARRCLPALPDPALETLASDVAKRYEPTHELAVVPGTNGPSLFREVGDVLRHYVALDEGWEYDVASLWVLMAVSSGALSAVFSVVCSERQGKGKTTALRLLSKLTGTLNASDISPAALVHWLKDHRNGAVCIDEFDVTRDAERDSALAAVVRTGYTRDGSYERWDPMARRADSCPTFGAKALGYRGKVDDATEDRVFILPLRPSVPGRNGARLVTRNNRLQLGSLPERLRKWGEIAAAQPQLEDSESDAWLSKIEAVIGKDNIGANRETQLADVGLRVCQLGGVDLAVSLQAAFGIRREVASANISTELEEAREVLALFETNALTKDASFIVVRQREFMERLNAQRSERGLRPLRDGAKLRTDRGIRPTWLTHPRNKVTWNIPVKEWASVIGSSTLTQGEPNPPNPPNPTVTDEKVRSVSQVGQPSPEESGSPEQVAQRLGWLRSQGYDEQDPRVTFLRSRLSETVPITTGREGA